MSLKDSDNDMPDVTIEEDYIMSTNSEDYLFVYKCTMMQSVQKLPTGCRVPYSPMGYEYDMYDLCLLATTMLELLCALGNDDYL